MDRVEFRDQVDAVGFVQLSGLVLSDKGLTDGAKVTYMTLLWYARQNNICYPGQDTLSTWRGMTTRSVRNHVAELEKSGLVSVQHRGTAKTNIYVIESIRTVYAEHDDPFQLTPETLERCWMPSMPMPQPTPPEGVPAAPRKQISITTSAEAVVSAQKTSRAARARRLKELEAKNSRKVDTGQALSIRKGYTTTTLRKFWDRTYIDKFGSSPEKWAVKQTTIAKKLLGSHSSEEVEAVVENVIANWEDHLVRFDASGYPSISFVWGFRETLFPEMKHGVLDGREMRRRRKLTEDECDATDNATGAQHGAHTTGWG